MGRVVGVLGTSLGLFPLLSVFVSLSPVCVCL